LPQLGSCGTRVDDRPAEREKDAELALYATGLAIDLGLPTVAVRAAHIAKLWADPAGQAVAFAAQGIVGHLPPDWAESWSQHEHVAAALAVEVPRRGGLEP
jgi:hypothetical protein